MSTDYSGFESLHPSDLDTPDEQCHPVSDAHRERVARLFETEHDRVVHFTVAMTGTLFEARDVVAQAFTKLLEIRPSEVEHLKAYVYRIARNVALNRAKARAVRRRLDKVVVHELPASDSSPEPDLVEEQRVEQQEARLRVLQSAIDRLPARCRMAVQLRVWDELPYSEILKRFASNGVIVNERTVRRWVVHAYEYCRQEIVRAEESEGRTD